MCVRGAKEKGVGGGLSRVNVLKLCDSGKNCELKSRADWGHKDSG